MRDSDRARRKIVRSVFGCTETFLYNWSIKNDNCTMDEKKDRRHWTITCYDENGVPTYTEKKPITTELEAIELCYKINISGHQLHKVAAYKCPVCFQWHIGHTETVLDTKTRSKIAQQYRKFKIANK